ncbi:hypothetical protein SRHO_G00286940 [Serrasalmus rhombeus]
MLGHFGPLAESVLGRGRKATSPSEARPGDKQELGTWRSCAELGKQLYFSGSGPCLGRYKPYHFSRDTNGFGVCHAAKAFTSKCRLEEPAFRKEAEEPEQADNFIFIYPNQPSLERARLRDILTSTSM